MKNTVATFKKMKNEGTKISMLTAYDYSTAKLVDEAGINSILVGDSLGMVMLGYEDTLSVTMEDMIHHTAAVARGAKNALVVGDMPFMSYEVSVEQAVINAGRLMKEGRANAVKLEGGVRVAEQIKAINKEMGREDDPQAEIAELEQMLKAKNMPEEAREKGMSELKKLRMMAPASAEYAIVRNYVDWILELPWNDMRETSIDIPEARAILDADHFGLEKPKQRILEFLAVQKLTNALRESVETRIPHPLPRRASRRGQDLAGPLRRHGHGARIRAPVPRRRARRSRNPRPPAHLRGRHARQDHHGPQARQVQQPAVLPR